jgi:hypothetical protein
MVADQLSVRDAAKILRWSEPKAYRVSATPEFRKAHSARILAVCDEIMANAVGAHREAMAVLRALLASESDSIRLDAAKAVLGQFAKLYEAAGKQHLDSHVAIARREYYQNTDPFPWASQEATPAA